MSEIHYDVVDSLRYCSSLLNRQEIFKIGDLVRVATHLGYWTVAGFDLSDDGKRLYTLRSLSEYGSTSKTLTYVPGEVMSKASIDTDRICKAQRTSLAANLSIDPKDLAKIYDQSIKNIKELLDMPVKTNNSNSTTTAKPALPEIKKVIYSNPATIVIWADKTKTVVKCGKNDTYDPEKGLAMCIAKKVLGNEGHYYETFKKHLPKEDK